MKNLLKAPKIVAGIGVVGLACIIGYTVTVAFVAMFCKLFFRAARVPIEVMALLSSAWIVIGIISGVSLVKWILKRHSELPHAAPSDSLSRKG